MKPWLRRAVYRLTAKRLPAVLPDVRHIRVPRDDIAYFRLSTNPILSFTAEGKLCYFRECSRILPARRYACDAIDDFFATLDRFGIPSEHFRQAIPLRVTFTGEETASFRQYLTAKIADRRVFKCLTRADSISDRCGFSIWETQTYDAAFFAAFGLDDLDPALFDIALYFLWHMRSAATRYRMLGITRSRRYDCFNAVRSIATRLVAEALGLAHLVTTADWCILEADENTRLLGVLSHAANGVRMLDTHAEPSGSLQRDLLDLHTLDVICNQPDHGPNNYNIATTDHTDSVCAFDNDNARTFFPSSAVSGAFAGCSPLIDERGRIARPYFDRALADTLAQLDLCALDRQLRPYLNVLQRKALRRRIQRLRAAIRATAEERAGFLLAPSEWTAQTAKEELNGSFGITYLTRAVYPEPASRP